MCATSGIVRSVRGGASSDTTVRRPSRPSVSTRPPGRNSKFVRFAAGCPVAIGTGVKPAGITTAVSAASAGGRVTTAPAISSGTTRRAVTTFRPPLTIGAPKHRNSSFITVPHHHRRKGI